MAQQSLRRKERSVFVCTACGAQAARWEGRCAQCDEWNTIVEQKPTAIEADTHRFASLAGASEVQNLAQIQAKELERRHTGLAELDRALGGGMVAGGVILIGGDPGVGKSTLLLQTVSSMATQWPVLYVTGEESAQQVALRARRLALPTEQVHLQAEIRLETIIATLIERQPQVVIIDSIQTLYSSELSAAPGSVSQVRECAAQLTRVAKQHGMSMVFIGHVTKDGALAGPRVLEHIVDTVLYFEGDSYSSFRLIRVLQYSFGVDNELGGFVRMYMGCCVFISLWD